MQELMEDLKRQLNKDKSLHRAFSARLIEKAKRDEYIELIELREPERLEKEQQKIFANKEGDLVLQKSKNTKDVVDILEWSCLMSALIDLYRHAGAIKRLNATIKHSRTCHHFILRNKYRHVSIIHYDGALRRQKADDFDWSYDEALSAMYLETYIPNNDRDKQHPPKGKTGTRRFTKKKENKKTSHICYGWADGGCSRSDDVCHFLHACSFCNMGPKDRHILSKCPNKKASIRSGTRS